MYNTLYGTGTYVPNDSVLDVTISPADATSSWYQSLPYVRRYIPNYGEMRIETSASTVKEELDKVSGAK